MPSRRTCGETDEVRNYKMKNFFKSLVLAFNFALQSS